MHSMARTVSTHHATGDAARAYFEYQQLAEDMRGDMVARKYAPYINPTDTLVDFGCGAAGATLRLNCFRRLGVEPNEHARALATRRGIEMYLVAADLPPAIADVVISNHALEHTLNPCGELTDLLSALKPGGKLVMFTPLDDWRTHRNIDRPDPNHHLYTWAPVHLRNLLTEVGFQVSSVSIINQAWPPKHEKVHAILPRRIFDALLPVWALLLRRRQVRVVALKP